MKGQSHWSLPWTSGVLVTRRGAGVGDTGESRAMAAQGLKSACSICPLPPLSDADKGTDNTGCVCANCFLGAVQHLYSFTCTHPFNPHNCPMKLSFTP